MIKAHSMARCGKCGRIYTWKQVADLGNRTKIEATIWANRQTQIKIVLRKFGDKYTYYVARSDVPTDKTRMLSDSKKMGKGTIKNTISIYDYAKRSRDIVTPNRKNEITLKRERQ